MSIITAIIIVDEKVSRKGQISVFFQRNLCLSRKRLLLMNNCSVHYQVPKVLVSEQIYGWLLLQIIWDSVGQVIKRFF